MNTRTYESVAAKLQRIQNRAEEIRNRIMVLRLDSHYEQAALLRDALDDVEQVLDAINDPGMHEQLAEIQENLNKKLLKTAASEVR